MGLQQHCIFGSVVTLLGIVSSYSSILIMLGYTLATLAVLIRQVVLILSGETTVGFIQFKTTTLLLLRVLFSLNVRRVGASASGSR